jgi:hypothetical protein
MAAAKRVAAHPVGIWSNGPHRRERRTERVGDGGAEEIARALGAIPSTTCELVVPRACLDTDSGFDGLLRLLRRHDVKLKTLSVSGSSTGLVPRASASARLLAALREGGSRDSLWCFDCVIDMDDELDEGGEIRDMVAANKIIRAFILGPESDALQARGALAREISLSSRLDASLIVQAMCMSQELPAELDWGWASGNGRAEAVSRFYAKCVHCCTTNKWDH